ncbi:unnamed protein product [Rotaria sordida]|uniref:MARVEL domain-containing protein n=2 Tax=Rotaria sordida TaxID=392033 RepID=A0A815M187_9BILA|nr:unnamed protein product [Rotaria sordida]
MSSTDIRYPNETNISGSSPPVVTPHYNSTLPNPPNDPASSRPTRCATGVRFFTTIHGILNIIIFVALICVIISAGAADKGRIVDGFSSFSKAKVSAFHTRNADLAFAVIGLILIIIDTVLHAGRFIYRLPTIFDTAFIFAMLVLAFIYLILGCCSAAWEKKVRDVGKIQYIPHKGAAASASFFLFVAMIAVIINFLLRLFNRPPQTYNPSAIINRNAHVIRTETDGAARI